VKEAAQPAAPPLVMVCGDDEFAVKRRARQVWGEWIAQSPGADEEIIDAAAGNTDEALKALARVREALQTLPFFGGTKSIWFRDCNFMGEDRVSDVEAVTSELASFARELGAFRWSGVRLLISGGKLDRRRSFAKAIEKLAAFELFPGLSADDKEWQDKAENLAAGELRALGKRIDGDALSALVEQVGPNARHLAAESQKLAMYVGERPEIRLPDVEAIVTKGRHARAFALGDAFGDRNLARTLRTLDDELWSMQSDKQKSEIGLLYGLISKVRAMLLAKELQREGLIKPASDYRSFSAQLAPLKNLPPGRLPTDRRYNPVDLNPYVLFRASAQARNFSSEELVAAMGELLRCNRQLVGSSLDGAMVLQLALVRILGGRPPRDAAPLDARGARA